MRTTLLALLIAIPAWTDEAFEARHARELANNPGDLTFTLRLGSGKGPYHPGERIPIYLEFSSTSKDKYRADLTQHVSPGGLLSDEFVIEQSGVVDPYVDYYGSGVIGYAGSGSRSIYVLEPKPAQVELQLNDWFRFDGAGHYRLYLRSYRLTRIRPAGDSGPRPEPLATTSNIIEVGITERNQEWEAALLAETRGKFQEDARNALLTLRYLATPEAVQLILENAKASGISPNDLDLIGARDRASTVAALDRYLADPDVTLRVGDIWLRALLHLVAAGDLKPLPMSVWAVAAEADRASIGAEAARRAKQFDDLLRKRAEWLIPIVKRKNPPARKPSAQVIAKFAPEAARATGLLPSEDFPFSGEQLRVHFFELTEDQQELLLGRKWDLVRGPEMVPILKKVVLTTAENVAEIAVTRLEELSPAALRELLREDLITGAHAVTRFLSEFELESESVPEADAQFSAELRAGELAAMPLVARFGSAGLASQVRDLFQTIPRFCMGRSPFVAYFLRTAPTEGETILRRELADRAERGCHHMLLGEVAMIVWTPALEKVAIEALSDPDLQTAANAVQVLAQHGSVSVEPHLWKTLEQWSEKWRGRSAELEGDPAGASSTPEAALLGGALFHGMASARAWRMDEARRERLRSLCITDNCRNAWSAPTGNGPTIISVVGGSRGTFDFEGYPAPTIGTLKDRLRLFPASSKFLWCLGGAAADGFPTTGQIEDWLREIRDFLSGISMSIEAGSKSTCTPKD